MRGPGLLLVLVAAAALAGCSARRGSAVVDEPLKLGLDARRGEIAFFRQCSQCHPFGEAGLGPALNNKPLPAALIRTQVRRGLGAMPAFDARELSDATLDDLIAYMKALRRRG